MTLRPNARHGFVVPAYGASPFLEPCLKSLLEQEATGGILITTSTPNETVLALAERNGVEVIVNSARNGIGSDWNFALAQAPWPTVTLAHQDDVYDRRFAALSLSALDRNPDAAIVFTSHGEITDADERRSRLIWWVKMAIETFTVGSSERITGYRRKLLLSFGDPIGCSAVTFNRAVIPDFRFDPELTVCLDWEAWWRLHEQNYAFGHVPEQLVWRRYNDLAETWSGVRDGRRAREDALMFQRIWPRPLARVWAALYRVSYQVQ